MLKQRRLADVHAQDMLTPKNYTSSSMKASELLLSGEDAGRSAGKEHETSGLTISL